MIFRQKLQQFTVLLRSRKVDSQLNISIEDPSQFTVYGILEIINKIGDGCGHRGKTAICKNFVRRCYRKVEDNRDVIGDILTMLPSDIYGSLISGGFTLVMAVSPSRALSVAYFADSLTCNYLIFPRL